MQGKVVKMLEYPDCGHDNFYPKLYQNFLAANLEWVEKYIN